MTDLATLVYDILNTPLFQIHNTELPGDLAQMVITCHEYGTYNEAATTPRGWPPRPSPRAKDWTPRRSKGSRGEEKRTPGLANRPSPVMAKEGGGRAALERPTSNVPLQADPERAGPAVLLWVLGSLPSCRSRSFLPLGVLARLFRLTMWC